jgi:hypothetical protein
MQKTTNWALIVSILCLLGVVGLLYVVMTIEIPEAPVIPVIPTAAEVAVEVNKLIVIPELPSVETHLGVRGEKILIAEDLVAEEMDDRDFKEDVADLLTDDCDDVDIERRDITDIRIKEADYLGFSSNMPTSDESGTILYELKIYFDNDGDEDEAEKALIEVRFYVTDLDYDDNYDDAEVDGIDMDFIKGYGDLDC